MPEPLARIKPKKVKKTNHNRINLCIIDADDNNPHPLLCIVPDYHHNDIVYDEDLNNLPELVKTGELTTSQQVVIPMYQLTLKTKHKSPAGNKDLELYCSLKDLPEPSIIKVKLKGINKEDSGISHDDEEGTIIYGEPGTL